MQNEFDYMKYLGLLNKHKRLFVVTALIVMTGAAVIGYLLPKEYEAQSTIFIEKTVLNDLVQGIAVTSSMDREDTSSVNYQYDNKEQGHPDKSHE